MKYDINLTPGDLSLDGRQLDTLIDLWIQSLELRPDLDPATVAGYVNRVNYFRDWWAVQGPACDWELTRRRLHDFGQWLTTVESQYGKPLEYNSRRDVVRRLKSCLRWAFLNNYLPVDITTWLPPVTGSARLRKRASLDDLYALLEAAGRSGCPVRDQAYVALLIGTGLRKMEAVNINMADVELNPDLTGTIKVGRAKRVKGRTVQGRVVAFDGWTGHFLTALMATITDAKGPLFRVPGSDRRIGAMAAYRVVKRAIHRAGLDDVLDGPHDLRRNFATWFSKEHRGELYGGLLSKQLGHAQFIQTNDYILHDADDLVDVIESPLAGRPFPKAKNARRRSR